MATAQIVKPRVRWDAVVHEVQQHAAHVFHVNEVPGLVAVREVGTVAAEKLHAARGFHLTVGVQDHRSHAAFVEFIGPVYVEELEAGPEVRLALLGEGPRVEVVLGPSVGVEGFKVTHNFVAVHVSLAAVAVRGRRTGVDERQPKLHTQVPNVFRVLQVECSQEFLVLFCGVRAGPEVEHELHLRLVLAEPCTEILAVHALGQVEVGVVGAFGLHTEVIDQDQLAVIRLQQPDGKHASNEACSSCNHNHGAKVAR